MSVPNLFGLIEIKDVQKQVRLQRSTIWKRVKEGNFPLPVGGRKRACWTNIQISDYLYQLSRFGDWNADRANQTLDATFSNTIGVHPQQKETEQ